MLSTVHVLRYFIPWPTLNCITVSFSGSQTLCSKAYDGSAVYHTMRKLTEYCCRPGVSGLCVDVWFAIRCDVAKCLWLYVIEFRPIFSSVHFFPLCIFLQSWKPRLFHHIQQYSSYIEINLIFRIIYYFHARRLKRLTFKLDSFISSLNLNFCTVF